MPPTAKKKAVKKTSDRPIVYPEVKATLCHGEKPITVETAKKLLGWQELDAKAKDYHFIDKQGKRIKCHNNVTNRPLYLSVVATYSQEILRKRWAGPNGTKSTINGEPIIIGKTGFVLNGQHQLISLIFAFQDWADSPEKWPDWDEEPVIDKLVIFGIDESDNVVNTMDTCKPRTLADAIYRSEYFADMPRDKDRKTVARILDYAVKMLWHRTGADANAFAPRRTHSEALAFIAKHPKILEAVKHIYEEDSDNKQVTRYISTGYAAGLLYLMGCCQTENVEAYKESPDEGMLNFDRWDEAMDFWVKLAGNDKSLSAVQSAIARIEGGGSRTERTGIIIKAWLLSSAGKSVTPSGVSVEYSEDEDGFKTLTDFPTLGGIDSVEFDTTVDPTPEELEERAEEIRKENDVKKAAGPKSRKKSKPVETEEVELAIGVQVWVTEEEGGYSTGKVVDLYDGPEGLVAKVKYKSGKTFETPAESCLTTQPEDL